MEIQIFCLLAATFSVPPSRPPVDACCVRVCCCSEASLASSVRLRRRPPLQLQLATCDLRLRLRLATRSSASSSSRPSPSQLAPLPRRRLRRARGPLVAVVVVVAAAAVSSVSSQQMLPRRPSRAFWRSPGPFVRSLARLPPSSAPPTNCCSLPPFPQARRAPRAHARHGLEPIDCCPLVATLGAATR